MPSRQFSSIESHPNCCQIKAEQSWYRTLYENLPSLYFTLDSAGFIVTFNQFGAARLGYAESELTCQSIYEIVCPEDRQTLRAALDSFSQQLNRVGNWEGRLACKEGSTVWVRAIARALPISTGCRNAGEPGSAGEESLSSAFSSPIILLNCCEIPPAEIEEKQRRQEEQNLRKQSQAILALAKNQTVCRGDLKAALREITEIAANILEVERVSVWMYKEENSRTICLDLYELSSDRHSEGAVLEATDYPAYFEALEELHPIAATDAHTDPRTKEFSQSYLSVLGITSMLDVPIWLNGQMVGVICHEHTGTLRQWQPQEEEFATTCAHFVALAMANSQRMQAEAQRREREQFLLSQYYDRLEREVEERTAELLQANEQLQAEIAKRGQTEAELRRQQQEQQIIFNSVPAMIWRKDKENRILQINKPAAELTGMSVEAQVGKSLAELYPEQAEQYYKDDLEVIQSGNPKYSIVEPLKTASGEIRWIRTDKLPYRDMAGEIVGVIVFAVDITERLRIEEELKQYQNHLEELVEVRTQELKTANEQLQREISDRHLVEAEMARSLSLLHATLESTADGILAVSIDKTLITYNQKFVEMWGIPEELMTSPDGQSRLAFLANQLKDPQAFLLRLQQLYAQPDARGYDILELKDGRVFERYSLPQRLGAEIIGRVWNFRDITRFK